MIGNFFYHMSSKHLCTYQNLHYRSPFAHFAVYMCSRNMRRQTVTYKQISSSPLSLYVMQTDCLKNCESTLYVCAVVLNKTVLI